MENLRLEIASRVPWAVFPRKRLDASYTDFYSTLPHCLAQPPDEANFAQVASALETSFYPANPTQSFATLSVRTTWDLFLRALDLPKGSEVIMSGITIKDMVKIPESHGLVPIAIDVDPETLEIDIEMLQQAINEKSSAIIVSHIFGAIGDMRPIIALAKQHNIPVFEDCAEAYVGPDYRGHPESTVSSFSFGTIKTDTALGGSLNVVTDPELLSKMRAVCMPLLKDSFVYVLHLTSSLSVHNIYARPMLCSLDDHNLISSREFSNI